MEEDGIREKYLNCRSMHVKDVSEIPIDRTQITLSPLYFLLDITKESNG